MSLTFLAKSSAYSWKMSFDGQVLCQRMLIGPCALTTAGSGDGGGRRDGRTLQELATRITPRSDLSDIVCFLP